MLRQHEAGRDHAPWVRADIPAALTSAPSSLLLWTPPPSCNYVYLFTLWVQTRIFPGCCQMQRVSVVCGTFKRRRDVWVQRRAPRCHNELVKEDWKECVKSARAHLQKEEEGVEALLSPISVSRRGYPPIHQ